MAHFSLHFTSLHFSQLTWGSRTAFTADDQASQTASQLASTQPARVEVSSDPAGKPLLLLNLRYRAVWAEGGAR